MALLGLECQEAPEDRVEPDHMGRVPSRQGILGRTRGGLGFPQTPAVSKLTEQPGKEGNSDWRNQTEDGWRGPGYGMAMG